MMANIWIVNEPAKKKKKKRKESCEWSRCLQIPGCLKYLDPWLALLLLYFLFISLVLRMMGWKKIRDSSLLGHEFFWGLKSHKWLAHGYTYIFYGQISKGKSDSEISVTWMIVQCSRRTIRWPNFGLYHRKKKKKSVWKLSFILAL